MTDKIEKDPILELFIFETLELVSQLENITLSSEKANAIESQINEVFRIVHTIKGSAAMMNYENIASITHFLEDAFCHIREKHPENVDYSSLADIVLKSTDFIKDQVSKIQCGKNPDYDVSLIVEEINNFVSILKNENESQTYQAKSPDPGRRKYNDIHDETGQNRFKALVFFEDGCEMENIRAFNIIHSLEKAADIISYSPADIVENGITAEIIRNKGFEIEFLSDFSIDDVRTLFSNTLFLKEIRLEILNPLKEESLFKENKNAVVENEVINVKQSMISVNISKLDALMDLVGELVISQAMVVQNPDLDGMVLNSFNKASRQLQKVTNEIQDAVMSVRMVPLSATFQKMHRLVRDMGKKLNKEVKLKTIGEETEVDKNIIEHLSDPLMHLVRNAVDHGIETAEERMHSNKPPVGKIILEARSEGGDVFIIIRDDGKGLNRDEILQKAKKQGLLKKPEDELSDREIYSYIFLPGFSTKKEVTEFSGRGVGMDVVNKNIEQVGGTVRIDSSAGLGTSIIVKIPLTLAIIDGMKVRVGKSIYVIPITTIKETFRARESAVIRDEANSRELMMIRGECCPILKLHEFFKIKPDTDNLEEGIIIVAESESRVMCLVADELLGEGQVVVKALPGYIKKVNGISGCTVMGNGNVSLIIDVSGLFNSS